MRDVVLLFFCVVALLWCVDEEARVLMFRETLNPNRASCGTWGGAAPFGRDWVGRMMDIESRTKQKMAILMLTAHQVTISHF